MTASVYPRLQRMLAERGYLMPDVAKAICVSPRTLTRKFNGDADFTLRECYLILDLLGVPDEALTTIFARRK